MNLALKITASLPAIAATSLVCAAHASTPTLSQKSLKPAVEEYLQAHGDFCLGKFGWPISVSERDRREGTNDAVQMPVLEKLGLVAAIGGGERTIAQYDLTDRGRKYYVFKKTVTLGPADKPIDHPGDLCPAHLKLVRVVRWEPLTVVDGRTRTTVNYIYAVASAADWTRDPEIQRVFPMLHRIVEGAGTLQLTQAFEWTKKGWVPALQGT
jgi:hypothetical protein